MAENVKKTTTTEETKVSKRDPMTAAQAIELVQDILNAWSKENGARSSADVQFGADRIRLLNA